MSETPQSVSEFWSSVPTVEQPNSTAPETLAPIPTSKMSRRIALKGAGVLGGALALNVLGAIPTPWLKPAQAAVGTQHTTCANYSNDAGYDNNTKVCVGASYARSYCGNDGWFLNHSDASFNSWPTKACGPSGDKRNAWQWTHSGTKYRCADGYQQVRGQSSVFRICSWAL